MITGIKAFRAQAEANLRAKVCGDIMGNIAVDKNYKTRVKKPIAQKLILNSPYTFNGKRYEAFAKHLGLGIYEITGKEV